MVNTPTGWHVASVEAPVIYRVSKHIYTGWSPCIDWCIENFGLSGPSWRFVGEGIFEFKEEPDLTAFLLRWS